MPGVAAGAVAEPEPGRVLPVRPVERTAAGVPVGVGRREQRQLPVPHLPGRRVHRLQLRRPVHGQLREDRDRYVCCHPGF